MGRMSETLTGSVYAMTDGFLTNLYRGSTVALEGGTARTLMRTAIGAPRSRKRYRTEAIAFASFARILVKTCFSRSLLMLFSQLRAASSRPLSWHSKVRNHNPCRIDLSLNFMTRPRVIGLRCSSLDNCDGPGMVHWSSHGATIAL